MAVIVPTNTSHKDAVFRYEFIDYLPSTIEEDTMVIPVGKLSYLEWYAKGNPNTGTIQSWYQAEKDAVTESTEIRISWADSGGTGNPNVTDLITVTHGSFGRYATATQSGNSPIFLPPGVITFRFNITVAVQYAIVAIQVIEIP